VGQVGFVTRQRNVFRFSSPYQLTESPPPRRDRTRDLPPPLALYAAARQSNGLLHKAPPRWLIPLLVVALVIAASVAVAAYWPFPRPTATAPLYASIEINRASGPHPLSVTVTANVSGGTPPYRYAWSFGDGTNSSAAGSTHVYASRGIFQLLLSVTDHDRRIAAASATVTVDPVQAKSTVLNASNQTLGAGSASAWVVPITVPATALTAWVNGTVNVTGCSLGGNCAAYVEILNVHDETNLTHGNAITNPIWCHEVNGTCQSNRTTDLAVDLSEFPGQTVYLVVFNDDLVWTQVVSGLIWTDCWY
jgi:hypothetical protein